MVNANIQRQDHHVQVFNFQSVVFTDSFVKAVMVNVSVQVLQFSWQQFSNI